LHGGINGNGDGLRMLHRQSSKARRFSTLPGSGIGATAAQHLVDATHHLRHLNRDAQHLNKDIMHVNTGVEMLEVLHRVVYGPPVLVLLFFLLIYVLTVSLFGFILLVTGDQDCYRLEGPINFAAMMWVSMHAFSTIGFGNIAPTQACTSAHSIILFESFVSLLIHSAIGGYVVKLFMRPVRCVRFSKVVLINHGRRRVAITTENDDQTGKGACDNAPRLPLHRNGHSDRRHPEKMPDRFVTFRVVRQGRLQLRDVRVQMQAQYVEGNMDLGDRDSHKGRVVNLALEQNYFTTLEQLQVWHRIGHESPLWRMRDSLDEQLDGVEVSVSAFDMASLQQVMFFKRYEKDDIKQGFVFENTLVPCERKGKSILLADHSKLDLYSEEDPPKHQPPRQKVRRFSGDPEQLMRAILPSTTRQAKPRPCESSTLPNSKPRRLSRSHVASAPVQEVRL